MAPRPPLSRNESAELLFSEAIELPPRARREFVLDRCSSDPSLAESVFRLLDGFDRLGTFLETSPAPFATAARLEPGSLLCDRFRITAHIADGGMGEVYRASDQLLEEEVALKLVRSVWRSEPEMVERFRQEIRLARKVSHPNVCRVFDVFTHTAGPSGPLLFFTMELLAGETLAERLKQRGALPSPEVLAIAAQLASGLEAAHNASIIHGDLKPANIHLIPDAAGRQRVVITDFGLATAFGHLAEPTLRDASIGGTPEYMAPEQFGGAPLTPAVDVYALGIVLFEMLAGHRPWPTESLIRTAVRRLTEPPPRLGDARPDLARPWDDLLARTLARTPSDRIRSASAFLHALNSSLAAPLRPRVFSRRKLVLGTASAGILSSFALWLRYKDKSPPVPRAPQAMLTPITDAPDARKAKVLDLFLAGQLDNSAILRLLPPERVSSVRQRMGLSGAPGDRAEARQVAMRAGAALLLGGRCLTTFTGRPILEVEVELMGASPQAPAGIWKESFPLDATPSAIARQAALWVRNSVLRESREDLAVPRPTPEELTTPSWNALTEYMAAQDAWSAARSGRNPVIDRSPLAAAQAHLEAALAADPEFALAAGRLADLLLAGGHRDDAMAAYLRAAELFSRKNLSDRESYRMRGLFALDTGNNDAADRTFYRYALEFPYDALPLYYRAAALSRLGRRPQALESYDRALAIEPASYAYLIGRGICLLALNRLPEAQRGNEAGSRILNRDWTDQLSSALAFARQDAAALRAALARMSAGSEEFQSKAFTLQACFHAERGDLQSARAALQHGLDFDRRTGRPQDDSLGKTRKLAELSLSEGDAREARRLCLQALAEQPGQQLRMELGAVLARAGDPDAAQACLNPLPDSPLAARWPECGKWPVFLYRSHCLQAEILSARGSHAAALELVRNLRDPWDWTWPANAVRIAVRAGALELARRWVAALAAAPAYYWLHADHNEIAFVRQAREFLDRDRGKTGLSAPSLPRWD